MRSTYMPFLPGAVQLPMVIGLLFHPSLKEWLSIIAYQLEQQAPWEGRYQGFNPGVVEGLFRVHFHLLHRAGVADCALCLLPAMMWSTFAVTQRVARHTCGACGGGLIQAATQASALAPTPHRAHRAWPPARRPSASAPRRRAMGQYRYVHVLLTPPGG